jgi:hypothetical protein
LRAAALLFLLAACDGPPTHILPGSLYEVGRDCVDPTASIDVVIGPDPGNACMPTCLVTPAGQNGAPAGIYVTTECPPYPPLDDTSGSQPGCAGALAAYANGAVCAAAADDGGAGDADDGGGSAEGGDGSPGP